MNKTDHVVSLLSERIRKEEWSQGAPLPSVIALAKQVGVSPTTVSLALRKLAAEGLVRIRPRLGVFVAEVNEESQAVPPLRAAAIGLCGSYIGEGVFFGGAEGGLVAAIWEAIQQSEMPVSLIPQSIRKAPLTPSRCLDLGLAGVVFLGGDSQEEAMALRSAGFPVILGNRPLKQTAINYVDYDHGLVLQDIMRRFLAAGHQRIAVISTETSIKGFYRQFKPVYIEELCNAGLAYLFNDYWKETSFYISEEIFNKSTERALDELFALPEPPTAIFSFSAISDQVIRAYFERKGIQISTASSDIKPDSIGGSSGYQSANHHFASVLLEGIAATIQNPFFSCQALIPMTFFDRGTIYPCPSENRRK